MKSRAFTLVELMLAVAIVALLATTVLGLFRWSRTRAGTAVSSSNLRQLVNANLAYAADHAGRFCPAQEPRNLIRWHGGRETVEAPFEANKGFLTPYLGGDRRLETCPLLVAVLEGAASFEDGAGGYGYNATYIGGRPGDAYSSAGLLDLQVPGRTLMFATTALAKEDGLQEYPFAEPPFAPAEDGSKAGELQPSVHFRAGGKAIVAWCDGGISLEEPSAFKETNFYGGNNEKHRIGWFGPEAENGFWNPQSPAVLDGWSPAPAQENGGGDGSTSDDGTGNAAEKR